MFLCSLCANASLFLFLFLVLYHKNCVVYSWGELDPPDYAQHLREIMNISDRQMKKFITATWKLPEVTSNPSIQHWLFDDEPGHAHLVMSWCSGSYSCKYMVFAVGNFSSNEWKDPINWKVIHPVDSFEVFLHHHDGGVGRHPLLVGDIRLYRIKEDKSRIVFITSEPGSKLQELAYADLFFDHTLDAFYILQPPTKMNIDHEMGSRHQKNWSPFAFEYVSYPEQRRETLNMFIYSVHPHRIILANESEPNFSYDMKRVHTVAVTEYTHLDPSEPIWKYGEPRGGTPAVLINTKYGKRYITLFHSQCHCMASWCLTYFMGAYLFEAEPPFAVTHISPEPIIPQPLYDESNGWAFKTIDYIVFPVGLLALGPDDASSLLVTLGRNDNSGWAVVMDTAALVDDLVPVKSKVTLNKFHSHGYYSLDEQAGGRRAKA